MILNRLTFSQQSTTYLIANKNISIDNCISNIENFLAYRTDTAWQNIVKQTFSWYTNHKDEKLNIELPLVVEYLFFRKTKNVNLVPEEEIQQIIAHERGLKGQEFIPTTQWWHCYHDMGFDILTRDKYFKHMSKEEKKIKSIKYPIKKGLALMSTRPGSKFVTRQFNEDDPLDWLMKKKEFDNRCASCGVLEGQFNETGFMVKLEKGHINPLLPYSHSNIIPQCSSCNNHSGNEIYGITNESCGLYIVIEKITN